MKRVLFHSVTPYLGKLAPESKKVPKKRTNEPFYVTSFSFWFDNDGSTQEGNVQKEGEAGQTEGSHSGERV